VSEERTKKRPAASACRAFAPSAGGHTANKKQKRHTQKKKKEKKTSGERMPGVGLFCRRAHCK
jgi:ribosomal protein L12E/L44/L45/RPP1/RPP2